MGLGFRSSVGFGLQITPKLLVLHMRFIGRLLVCPLYQPQWWQSHMLISVTSSKQPRNAALQHSASKALVEYFDESRCKQVGPG